MVKRTVDICFSFLGLLLLSPILCFIALLIRIDSIGNPIFKQERVGLNEQLFYLFKFRSMTVNGESKGQLTVGMRDPRITRIGFYLRKFKLDELPQLWNVLKGEMSLVGPRPEVRKYVNLYTIEQRVVLKVKPGITDYASLQFRNENELLANAQNPENKYISEIMPQKLALNILYIQEQSLWVDLKIIFTTLFKILPFKD